MNHLEIKECEEKDIIYIGEFYDHVVYDMNQLHSNYPQWIYQIYPSLETVENAFLNHSQYYCLYNHQICGAFILNEDPDGAYEKAPWSMNLQRGEYLVIHTLAVDQQFLSQGIGSYIIQYCINIAKERGYKGIRLDVVPSNIPAIKLYQKMGFTYVGEYDLERDIEEIPVFSLFEYNL